MAIIPTSRTGSSRSKALLLEVPDLREQPTEIAPLAPQATDASSDGSDIAVAAPVARTCPAKAEVLKYTTIADSPAMVAFEWPALDDAADAPAPQVAEDQFSAANVPVADSRVEESGAENHSPEALLTDMEETSTAESLAGDQTDREEAVQEPAGEISAAETSAEPALQTVAEPATNTDVRQTVTDSVLTGIAASSVDAVVRSLPVSESPASSTTVTPTSESPDKTGSEEDGATEAVRNRPSSEVASLLRRPDPWKLKLQRRASSLGILALRGQLWIGQHRHSRRFWLGTASLVLIALSSTAMIVSSFRHTPEHLEFDEGDGFVHTPPAAMLVEEIAPDHGLPTPAKGTAPAAPLTPPATADAGRTVQAAPPTPTPPTPTIQTASYEAASPSTTRGAWLTGTIESDP